MSEVRQLRPFQFTPGNAPRQGGAVGRKRTLNAQALKIIDLLLKDFVKHGSESITIMRKERPDAYVRVVMELASRLVTAEHGGGALVQISINKFFADEPTTVTIDGADDNPAE